MCYKIITGAAVSQEAQNETNTSGGDEHVQVLKVYCAFKAHIKIHFCF